MVIPFLCEAAPNFVTLSFPPLCSLCLCGMANATLRECSFLNLAHFYTESVLGHEPQLKPEHNPLKVKINAIYSSDVGHWDVPDLTDPLAESWDLVQEGVISEADFKAYVFSNPYKFYTQANPNFFKGTAIESKVAAPVDKTLVTV